MRLHFRYERKREITIKMLNAECKMQSVTLLCVREGDGGDRGEREMAAEQAPALVRRGNDIRHGCRYCCFWHFKLHLWIIFKIFSFHFAQRLLSLSLPLPLFLSVYSSFTLHLAEC